MKGNMFLGYARGSVGDVTFARQKGQQVARARNRQPANPRTINQSMQRSLFANAVKFHSKGVQALFKFAFEDKRAAESDYNAFMRHNINSSIRISRYASESAVFPAFGKWMMSYGSLRSVTLEAGTQSGNNTWSFSSPSADSNMTTFGDFAECMRKDYGYMEGDIVTFVHIVANGSTVANMPAITPPEEGQPASWFLDQYKLESASTAYTGGIIQFDNGRIIFNRKNVASDIYAQGFAVIFSRPTSNGLLVSTSYLVGNDAFNTIWEKAHDSAYIEQVLLSWQTQEQAILQGSLLKSPEESGSIVDSILPSLPSNASEIVVNLTRDGFYTDPAEGLIVGRMNVDGRYYDITVTNIGSSISFSVADTPITGDGMRVSGAKITFDNRNGLTISDIEIYDI